MASGGNVNAKFSIINSEDVADAGNDMVSRSTIIILFLKTLFFK